MYNKLYEEPFVTVPTIAGITERINIYSKTTTTTTIRFTLKIIVDFFLFYETIKLNVYFRAVKSYSFASIVACTVHIYRLKYYEFILYARYVMTNKINNLFIVIERTNRRN